MTILIPSCLSESAIRLPERIREIKRVVEEKIRQGETPPRCSKRPRIERKDSKNLTYPNSLEGLGCKRNACSPSVYVMSIAEDFFHGELRSASDRYHSFDFLHFRLDFRVTGFASIQSAEDLEGCVVVVVLSNQSLRVGEYQVFCD